MNIGQRIKKIRNFRNLTQAQLGESVGLDGTRIRQYEIGNRTPKADLIEKIAAVLNCSPNALADPMLNSAEDIMYTLFELDEDYDISLHEIESQVTPGEKQLCVAFNYSLLDDLLSEWMKKKEEYNSGKITRQEYFEWKINWPNNGD